uniref:Cadherin n=1 Tax=Echinococcus canadensis TaxID=519352 RepID=A0A915EX38_9CEST
MSDKTCVNIVDEHKTTHADFHRRMLIEASADYFNANFYGEISSNLPSWLTTSVSMGDRTVSLVGLPFLCDTANSSDWTILACNSTFECQCIHIVTEKLSDKPPMFSCYCNRPIFATIKVGFKDFSNFLGSPTGRLKIWRKMKACMTGADVTLESSKVKREHALLVDEKPDFLSLLSNLAQANNDRKQVPTASEEHQKSLFFIWKIGCGYLDDNSLQILSKVENRLKESPDISDWMGLSSIQAEAIMLDWMVGEYDHVLKVRSKRQAFQGYQTIYPSRTAGAVTEASGMSPSDLRETHFSSSNANPPILVQPMVPIEITVQQISNIRIPPNTFHSPDGSKLQLRLFEHIYPMQFGLDFKDPSAARGREIGGNGASWISFDETNEILRLRPYPEHEGTHKFVLCAYNVANGQTCTNINVRVKPPTPIRKSSIIHVSPGVYWCYSIPVFWFSELRVDAITNIDISVTVAHDPLCSFRGTNRASAETVEVEFRVAVKVPPVEKMITSPRLRIRLRWTNTYNSYEMSEFSRLNSSLAQALRVRVNPSVKSQNIFIYDVVHMRKFQEKDSLPVSKILEVEFVYLPLGLPEADYMKNLSVLEDMTSSPWGKSGSSFGLTRESKQFSRLKNICENARLIGSMSAVQAAAESFLPFQLESVTELEVAGSACARILQSVDGSADVNKVYPGPLTTTNIPYSDQVIENFTVEAGLAFKKRINPTKVVPMNRVRTIEIIDENYNRLNDSAWITVAEDKTNLLSIVAVDQRTPINIHFTVDVVKWPLEMTLTSIKYDWFPRPTVVHNHRVRMRMKLGGTVGRGISPTYSWPPTSPETSLSYRWNLVTNLDKYLRPECSPHCGVGIILMDIQRQDQSVIQIEWAQLPLLQEGIRDVTRNLSYTALAPATNKCPQRSIQDLQRKLLKAPLYHRYSSPSSSVSSPHQEYFSENDLRQASWSSPAPQLIEHLEWARLGTTAVVAVDLIGSCFSPYWKGESSSRSATILSVVNVTTYVGETFRYPLSTDSTCFQSRSLSACLFDKDLIEVNETSWLSLDAGDCAIFGIAMKSAVSAGIHEFRIMTSPVGTLISRVIIHVGDRNPRLPEVPNHRVLMRFEPGYAVRADPRTHMLQTLRRKWEFLATIDEYLRPECRKIGRYVCANDMDLLLINVAPDGDVLNVIWAKKSLVYVPTPSSNRSVADSPYSSRHAPRPRQERVAYGEIPAPRISGPEHELSCPWNELEDFILLLQTGPPDSRVQPNLLRHFEQAGFGRLIGVKVEKLGHCSEQLEPSIPDRSKDFVLSPKGNRFVWDWKWDYGEFYDANGYNIDGQKTTSGLSTESPFYFMEFYNQDRSNDGSKRTSPNLQPDYSDKIPNPFDYLDRGLSNLPVTSQPNSEYPLAPPKIFQPQPEQQQPVGAQTQQRTFLITTLLPICAVIVILLTAALATIWFLKCRGRNSGREQKLHGIKNEGGGGGDIVDGDEVFTPERVPLKEDKKTLGKKNGLTIANNGNQMGNKTPQKSIGHLKDIDSVPSPPSKPLILPNEKPPLKPPELMPPLTKSAGEQTFQPRVAPSGSLSTRHFYAMGQRPDPYRNLPPPIDARFGVPRQMTPQFNPYRGNEGKRFCFIQTLHYFNF